MTCRKTEFAIDRASENGSGFMAAYFPVNDPLFPEDRLTSYDSARVDVIELGIMTTDPYADGAIIADSMRRAVGEGNILEAASAIDGIRSFGHDTMGMIFAYAERPLTSDPSDWKNVDGLLCLGKNNDQIAQLSLNAREYGTRITRFLPYDIPPLAVEFALGATGFVMLQYTHGESGLRDDIDPLLTSRLARLKASGVQRPILTGIGISSPEQVRQAMDSGADGVVLGSMPVLKGRQSKAALEDYLCCIRGILDGE